MTFTDDPAGMNVRSGSFFLAIAVGRCAHCGRQTAVVAIGLPAGYEQLEEGDWRTAPEPTLLFDIDALSADVGRVLRDCFPLFHPGGDAQSGARRWRNHCESCGDPQDDYWLHCEPAAPFLPLTPQAASRIDLVAIDAALLASACGFSAGVPFLDAMRRDG
jgi:ribosomal protein S14